MTPVRWGMAAVPVGGGAWPDNEPTRREKLAARTARGRVATHRHTQRPGTTGVEGAGGPVGLAAVPVGGGRAWPDNEATRRAKLAARTARGQVATHRHTQRPGTTGVEGAGGTGGHGRASRSTTPSRRLACGDLAGGRARRRPEHPWDHKQPGPPAQHNETRPRPVARPRPRHAHAAPFTTAPPAIRRSCPRGPRPRRGQPRGGRRGRGTGSRTRSRHPRCGRSGSTAGRHHARHTRRA